jgi:histidinol-phosphate aminotransferase
MSSPCSTRPTTNTCLRPSASIRPPGWQGCRIWSITRTFSKIYGLAGLRVGYALTSAEIADLMNRVRQPFNCQQSGARRAAAALDDHLFVADQLRAEPARHGADRRRPEAARLDAHSRRTATSSPSEAPTHRGSTRNCSSRASSSARSAVYGLPEWLRVTIGTESECARFLAALEGSL